MTLGIQDSYNIGADFCLSSTDEMGDPLMVNIELLCGISNLNAAVEGLLGQVYPRPPQRSWFLNGIVLYSEETTFPNGRIDIITEEFNDTYFPLVQFFPGFPTTQASSRFIEIRGGGAIVLQVGRNNTEDAFNIMFGEWICCVNNSVGGECNVTDIRPCGEFLYIDPGGFDNTLLQYSLDNLFLWGS